MANFLSHYSWCFHLSIWIIRLLWTWQNVCKSFTFVCRWIRCLCSDLSSHAFNLMGELISLVGSNPTRVCSIDCPSGLNHWSHMPYGYWGRPSPLIILSISPSVNNSPWVILATDPNKIFSHELLTPAFERFSRYTTNMVLTNISQRFVETTLRVLNLQKMFLIWNCLRNTLTWKLKNLVHVKKVLLPTPFLCFMWSFHFTFWSDFGEIFRLISWYFF